MIGKRLAILTLALCVAGSASTALSKFEQRKYGIDPSQFTEQQLLQLSNRINSNRTNMRKQLAVDALKRRFLRRNMLNRAHCPHNDVICEVTR